MAYTSIDKPWTYFRAKIYTGNAGSQSITFDETDVNMKPDWTWIKKRNGSADASIMDSVRGVRESLTPSNNEDNYTESAGLSAWDTNGFSFDGSGYDHVNTSNTFVAWNWLAGGTAPSQTYTVKVVDDSGNKYRFDDFGSSAVTLDLQEGGTYTFDASDSSVSSHPFVIGTSANSNEYSTGVTYQLDGVSKTYSEYTSGFSSASSRKLIITVAASAPTLYYWCSVHSGMGGQINTNTLHGSSQFGGTIQSRASVSSTAGFSIVQYEGTGSNATFGHGLGVAPDTVFVKNIDAAQNWLIYSGVIGNGKYVRLNLNNGEGSSSGVWNSTSPTTANVSVGTDSAVNASGNTHIAYCFKSTDGFRKFGSYNGTGNADGAFMYTGFKPAWLMIKDTDSTQSWFMYDNKRDTINPNTVLLTANNSSAEEDSASTGNTFDIDFMSNGFKIRTSDGGVNTSGNVYLYWCFAENPLVGSNDIPNTAG